MSETAAQVNRTLGVVGLGPFPQTANVAERPALTNEIQQNVQNLEGLHGLIAELEKRLEPMLSPESADAANAGNPATATSAVVAALRAQGHRIDAAAYRVRRLLDRIEL